MRGARRLARPQRALEHEQRGRPRAASARSATRVALGTDGIGSDMFEESRAGVLPPPARTTLGAGPRLAARAPRRGSAARRARLRASRCSGRIEPGAPADLVVLDYAAPAPLDDASFAGHWIFGLSSRAGPRRHGRGRVGRRSTAASRASTSDELARRRARPRPSGCGSRLDEIGPHPFEPEGRPAMAVTSEGRVALYLQDKHPIRDGMEYAQLAEQRGFEAVWQAESRLVREATVPMAAFAAVTERIAVGSGVVNNWTRNVGLLAATFSTLDDLAPGPDQARHRRVVGPARRQGRHPPPQAAAGDARDGRGVTRGCSRWSGSPYHGEFVHVDDIEIDIVHGDRSPKHVPIYIGATGDEDDGARRRDRRRRRCSTTSSAPATTARRWSTWRRAPRGPGARVDDVDRPQLVVCSLDADRVARARPGARARHAVPRPAAAHHEGERRRRRRCSRRSAASSPGRPRTEQIEQAMRLVPDEVVQLITASGTPDECRAKVREYVDAGCTCPSCTRSATTSRR